MTAGFTKGRSKYYLYYRCTKHVNKNYSGDVLHKQFEDLLENLSLNETQIAYVKENAKRELGKDLDNLEAATKSRRDQISKINNKIEKLEEKYIEEEMDSSTYKKWRKKYQEEKAAVENSMYTIDSSAIKRNLERVDRLLPSLMNLKNGSS